MIPKIRPSLILPILAPLFALIVWSLPIDMPHSAQQALGIMLWVALWWLSPVIPLHVSGLVGVVLAHFFGLASWKSLLASFADPIIFLFLGGFMLARAVELHGLDRALIQLTMRAKMMGGSPRLLYIVLILVTTSLSAFLSNTATAALVVPLAIEILRRHSRDFTQTAPLLLLVAAAASIGGTMTPVGSPPNMIALGLMEKITGSRPDFFTWVAHMMPLSLTVLVAMFWLYRKELKLLPTTGARTETSITLSGAQKKVALIFILTACLWIVPGLLPLLDSPLWGADMIQLFPESVVAILAALALLLTPHKEGVLLPWEKAQEIDWGTLLLFGSGLALGEMSFQSGLASFLGQKLEALQHFPPGFLLIIVILFTMTLTEIASNTATANMVIPVLLASSAFASTPEKTIYAVVAAANLAFMLPVGTPPNAIVFSTHTFSFATMVRKGLWANLLSALVIIVFVLLIF